MSEGLNTFTITVTAEDGVTDEDYTVAVTRAANHAPTFATTTYSRSVNENETSGTNVGAAITATDANN